MKVGFKQKERLDLSGKSLNLSNLRLQLGFGLGLFVTRNLTIACLALVLYVCFYASFGMICVRYYRKALVFQEKKPDLPGDLGWILSK